MLQKMTPELILELAKLWRQLQAESLRTFLARSTGHFDTDFDVPVDDGFDTTPKAPT
jgi:hypothetical protein